MIAIPAPDGRSATLAVRNHDESFRGKGNDSKGTAHKGKSKGSKSGKSGKNKGGKGKSSGKSNVKGMGDPLKQRLTSRTQCRLCGEGGHWEDDCPQADVDMPQAKRRGTFDRPPVSVFLKPGVSKLGRSRRRHKVLKLDPKRGRLKESNRVRMSVSP